MWASLLAVLTQPITFPFKPLLDQIQSVPISLGLGSQKRARDPAKGTSLHTSSDKRAERVSRVKVDQNRTPVVVQTHIAWIEVVLFESNQCSLRKANNSHHMSETETVQVTQCSCEISNHQRVVHACAIRFRIV